MEVRACRIMEAADENAVHYKLQFTRDWDSEIARLCRSRWLQVVLTPVSFAARTKAPNYLPCSSAICFWLDSLESSGSISPVREDPRTGWLYDCHQLSAAHNLLIFKCTLKLIAYLLRLLSECSLNKTQGLIGVSIRFNQLSRATFSSLQVLH